MMRRALCTLGVVLLVTACGFQLRGSADLPESLRLVHIEAPDTNSQFVRALNQRLVASGARVADEPDAKRLIILDEQLTNEPLAFGGDARVREFGLTFEVRYELRDAAGERMTEAQVVLVTRSYEFDEQAILAASREQDNLAVVLRQMAVERVLTGLSAMTSAP